MNDDTKEILDRLKHLKFQIEGAIVLIESGCVKPDPHYAAERTSPDTFIIGDFVVKNRFIEPRS